MTPPSFRIDPATYVTGIERDRAVRSLRCYRATIAGEHRYTGSLFDQLISTSDPNRFTANDIVAINMLAVDLPRPTAAWLLSDPGEELAKRLNEIPIDEAIWDRSAEAMHTGAATALWTLLGQQEGLGRYARTTKSKLLAAKRPHLLPIHDQYVGDVGLGYTDADDFWALWRNRFSGENGVELRQSVEDVQQSANAEGMTLLRVLDVVIWMRVYGWKHPRQAELSDFDLPVGEK